MSLLRTTPRIFNPATFLPKPASCAARPFSTTLRQLQGPRPPTGQQQEHEEQKQKPHNANPVSKPAPKRAGGQDQPLPVLPIVAIFLGGGYLFWALVQSPKPVPTIDPVQMPQDSSNTALPAVQRSKPLFTKDQATVIFVLGGPGAGKGTQCAKLVSDYGFKHLSAGDLLRAEQEREGSEFGDMIKTYIKEGKIVPMEVTIQLLENAMKEAMDTEGKKKFLIDGFPRQMDQALSFESTVVPSSFTLFFDCPEDVMLGRLLNRGLTSGRSDDNTESIKKRFKTFTETSMPVVDMFEKEGRAVKLNATQSPEKVYEDVKGVMKNKGIPLLK